MPDTLGLSLAKSILRLLFCALPRLARTAHPSLLHGVEVFRINQPFMPNFNCLQTLRPNQHPDSVRGYA